MMLRYLIISIVILSFQQVAIGQVPAPNMRRIEANPETGFSYPYYLIIPKSEVASDIRPILVSPNNTGSLDDDITIHEENVQRRIRQLENGFKQLNLPILMPVFPRPKTDWKIYTHALDRDSLATERNEYRRLDLQLVAMIDDARTLLEAEKIWTDKRVLMYGFSAAGMFTNRFAFLHPDRVLAAAVGSPGGWPISPASEFKGKKLRYPIGTFDLRSLTGKDVDLERLRKVRFFVFLGDKDENDSVIYGDSYEPEDKELIFELFGNRPVDRWEKSKAQYADAKLNAEFKLYTGIDHKMTLPIVADINQFFEAAMK